MEYNKIIAVTGMPGLYELLSSKTDGAIVRSLEDKSTKFVSSRIHNFSHLESIEVYTVRDNVNLVDILKAMEDSSEKLPDEKNNAGLKTYFGKVYPDLDFERVYSSDLKKMVKWFSVLKSNDIEIKLSEPAPEEVEEQEDEKTAAAETKRAKKKDTAPEKLKAAPAEKEKVPATKAKAHHAKVEEPKTKAKEKVKEKPAAEESKAKKPVVKKKAAPETKGKAATAAKAKKSAPAAKKKSK
jgi:Domain of unknown function (DUF5606)